MKIWPDFDGPDMISGATLLICDLSASVTFIPVLSVMSGSPVAVRAVASLLVYLADDCCLVSDSTRRSLRSADVPTCVVPRTLSSYSDRTFAAAAPRLWNSLPVQLCNPDITYRLFRRQLKGHFFS